MGRCGYSGLKIHFYCTKIKYKHFLTYCVSIHISRGFSYSSNRTGPVKRTVNKRCGYGGTRDNTRHMSESSRSGVSLLARGGCPLESRVSYREPSCSALHYNTSFLSKGRKQGQARVVQPSAELFDRMQRSAGKPRQSVS